jgi:hypothetical protein
MQLLSTLTVLLIAVFTGPRRSTGSDLVTYVVDPVESRLYVVTHKSGLLAFLGHEHAVIPLEWTSALCLADPVPAGAHGALVMSARSLVIDSDSARSVAGLGGGPGRDDVLVIQRRLLDGDHLAAEQYPEIRLETVAAEPEARGGLLVRGTLTIRGVSRSIELPVRVERSDSVGTLRLSGSLRVRQRDFGIEPESIARVVKVANEVDLHFSLAARPTSRPCAAAP